MVSSYKVPLKFEEAGHTSISICRLVTELDRKKQALAVAMGLRMRINQFHLMFLKILHKKNCTDVKLKAGQMVTFTDSGDGVQHTAIVFVSAGKQKANTKTGTMCSMLKLIAVRDKNKH